MLNFYSIILSSFGCFYKGLTVKTLLQISKGRKNGIRYNYYVGSGNNKNLIISIMKKRWWWVETDDISKADFVWSQVKVSFIMQNQPSMKYS